MSFFQKRITEEVQGFGTQLRALRELRGLTREELARLSGIHALMVKAFEEERFCELSDPMYAKRHVERLVSVMDGRVTYFKKIYIDALYAQGIVQAPKAQLLRPKLRRRDFFVSSKVVVAAGFSVLILLVGSYLAWHVHSVMAPPSLLVAEPIEGDRLTQPKVHISGQTEPAAFVKVDEQNAIVDATGHFSLDVDIPSGFSTITIEARRRNGSPITVERHITYDGHALSARIEGPNFPE